MVLTLEFLGVVLLSGSVVGWLAAKIAHGTRLGLGAVLLIGIVGAFIGGELQAPFLETGAVWIDYFIGALVGAILLLIIVRFVAQKVR